MGTPARTGQAPGQKTAQETAQKKGPKGTQLIGTAPVEATGRIRARGARPRTNRQTPTPVTVPSWVR